MSTLAQALAPVAATFAASKVKDQPMKTRKPRAKKTVIAELTNPTPKVRRVAPGFAAAQTIGTTYFDPMDTLMDKMGAQAPLYSRVADSLTWMLDASCISQARNVLFTRYKNADVETRDTFSNFCLTIHAALKHDSLYRDDVLEFQTPERTLSIMLALRHDWHDAVNSAFAADDRDYNPKSLRQLLENEKPQMASVAVRSNFAVLAKLEAKGDAAAEQRILNAMIEVDKINALERAHDNVSLAPTILEILRTVGNHAPDGARFDHLPLNKQKQLTEFSLGAIERSMVDMATRLRKQPLAFGRMAEAAFQTKEALNLVIRAKYAHLDDDLGNSTPPKAQVAIDFERAQKRRAICTID